MLVGIMHACLVHAIFTALALADCRDQCNTGHCEASARSSSLLQSSANVGKMRVHSQSLFGSPSNRTEPLQVNTSDIAFSALAVRRYGRIPAGVYVLAFLWVLSVLAVLACHRQEKSPDDAICHESYSRDREGKMFAYNNEKLLTWRIFLMNAPSMSLSWRVWIIVPCVLGVASCFALILSLEFTASNLLDIKRLEECEEYLKVFIAFMLGMFLKDSFSRWNLSVTNFRGLLTAVKSIMWTVRLMGLRAEIVVELERKLTLACHILDAEMHTDLSSKTVAWQSHWDVRFARLREKGLLFEAEEKELREQKEGALRHLDVDMGIYSTVVWAWIAGAIKRIRSEKNVLVPMYVRLVGLSHSCLSNIDKLKTTVQVQIPFTYVYLLSLVVHLNNVMLAICSGLEIGASLVTIDATAQQLATAPQPSSLSMLYTAIENLGLQTVLLLIQPIMYQSCLVIAHMLNHPFGDHIFHLPTETFLFLMHDEIAIASGSFDSDYFRDQDVQTQPPPKSDHAKDEREDDDSGGDDDDDDDDGGDDGGD